MPEDLTQEQSTETTTETPAEGATPETKSTDQASTPEAEEEDPEC